MLINKKLFLGLSSLIMLLAITACNERSNTSLYLPEAKFIQVNHPALLKVSVLSPATESIVVSFNSSDISVVKAVANCTIPKGSTTCSVEINGDSFGEAVITATSSSFSSATTEISSIVNPLVFFLEPNLMCYHEHKKCIPFSKI